MTNIFKIINNIIFYILFFTFPLFSYSSSGGLKDFKGFNINLTNYIHSDGSYISLDSGEPFSVDEASSLIFVAKYEGIWDTATCTDCVNNIEIRLEQNGVVLATDDSHIISDEPQSTVNYKTFSYEFGYAGEYTLVVCANNLHDDHTFNQTIEKTEFKIVVDGRDGPPWLCKEGVPKNVNRFGDPVNIFSGEFIQEEEDLRIKGKGFDFVWSRTYRHMSSMESDLGFSWDFSYNMYISTISGVASNPNSIILYDGNNRFERYNRNLPLTTQWLSSQSGFFQVINKNTVDGSYELVFSDKTKWIFHPLNHNIYPGKIHSIVDRNGNTMNFTYSGNDGSLTMIEDTLGRFIHIYYETLSNGTRRIDYIEDEFGRKVEYSYYGNGDGDGFIGDLKSVTSPKVDNTPNGNDFVSGKIRSYTYFKNGRDAHFLHSVRDGNNNIIVENYYNTGSKIVTENNVDYQLWGRDTQEQTTDIDADKVDFHYTTYSAPLANGAKYRTTINDRNGNVFVHFYDVNDLIVELWEYEEKAPSAIEKSNPDYPTTMPSGKKFIKKFEFNSDSLPTKITHPNGNVTRYTYQTTTDIHAKGNIAKIRHEKNVATTPDYPVMGYIWIDEEYLYDNNQGGGCCFNFASRMMDGEGRLVDISYDSNGNPDIIKRAISVSADNDINANITDAIETDVDFNSAGQIERIKHPKRPDGTQRVDEFNYFDVTDGVKNGFLKEIKVDVGGLNLTTTFDVDSRGNITTVTDPRGNVTTYVYNQLDQIVRMIKRGVDIDRNPATTTDIVNYQVDYYYDANNNITQIDTQNVDEEGNVLANSHISTTLGYDILNHVNLITREIDAIETAVTEIEYDDNRNIAKIIFGEAYDGRQTNNTITRTYDGRNLLKTETRAEGHTDATTVRYEYDDNKNLIRIVDADGSGDEHVYNYLYDGFDRMVQAIDPMGNVNVLHYDRSHNITQRQIFGELNDTTVLANASTLAPNADVLSLLPSTPLQDMTYTYDKANRLTDTIYNYYKLDASGNPTTITSDEDGDGLVETAYGYGAQSPFIQTITDDRGNSTTYNYDSVNRIASIQDAAGNTRTYTYDVNSNIKTVQELDKSSLNPGTGDQTVTTTFEYDALDRMIKRHYPHADLNHADNIAFEYFYDSRNNLTKFEDSLDKITKYQYDGLNRLTEMTRAFGSPDQVTIQQDWDDSSRLETRTDGNGNITTYVYDPLNRVDQIMYADGELYDYGYDKHHNLKTVTDPNGTVVTYNYDANHRVTSKTIAPGAGVSTETTSENFAYDGLSRLISASDNDSLVTFKYDSLSNVIEESLSINSGAAQTTAASYDGLGNLTDITYPSSRSIDYTYDSLNRIDTIVEGSSTLVDYDYIGRSRVERKRFNIVSGTVNGVESTHTYDALRRLDGITHSKGTDLLTQAFTWDKMFNKTSRTVDATTHNYAYDDLYRLDTFTYDDVGNRTNGSFDTGASSTDTYKMNEYAATPDGSMTYDDNGNLTDIGAAKDLDYNYRNLMVSHNDGSTATTYRYDALGRRISKTVGGTETRFVSFGSRVLEETDGTNTLQGNYVYGGYIDEVINMKRGSSQYYYHGDDQHNVMALSDPSGVLVQEYDYDDFGKQTETVSVTDNPYLFNGRRYDTESGLYYYRTRYMDPNQGRFTTRDSIGIWGDQANLGNGYTYVANNPQTFLDPNGDAVFVTCALVGLGLYTAYDAYQNWQVINDDESTPEEIVVASGNLLLDAIPGVGPAVKGGKVCCSIGKAGLNVAKDTVESLSTQYLRRKAVKEAWKNEKEKMIRGKPTRNWSPQQERDILEGKTPKSKNDGKPIEGHHKEPVANNPDLAGNPDNIEFRSFTEHRKKDSGIHSKNPDPYLVVDDTTTP